MSYSDTLSIFRHLILSWGIYSINYVQPFWEYIVSGCLISQCCLLSLPPNVNRLYFKLITDLYQVYVCRCLVLLLYLYSVMKRILYQLCVTILGIQHEWLCHLSRLFTILRHQSNKIMDCQ